MFNCEKWIALFLFAVSTFIKLGFIATLYSVYATPGQAIYGKQNDHREHLSNTIILTLNNNLLKQKL